MEYSYSKPGMSRTQALALAHHFDPKSTRLRDASAAEIQEAEAWFKTNSPFRGLFRAPQFPSSGDSAAAVTSSL
jgi:hypothetical protein